MKESLSRALEALERDDLEVAIAAAGYDRMRDDILSKPITYEVDLKDLSIEFLSMVWGMPIVEVSLLIDHHIVRGVE